MEWILVWIALCVIAGVVASNKGRSGLGFFLLAFFLSPLVGVIAALVARPSARNVEQRVIEEGDLKRCPYCAELIKQAAVVCRFCGRDVPVAVSEEPATRSVDVPQRSWVNYIWIVVLLFVIVMVAVEFFRHPRYAISSSFPTNNPW
jgi:hypothetical protein